MTPGLNLDNYHWLSRDFNGRRNRKSHKKCTCGGLPAQKTQPNSRVGNCKPAAVWLYSQQEARMPLFEFKCRDCGTTFEKIVPSSTTKVACKKCASPKVEKLLSVFAVGATRALGGRI